MNIWCVLIVAISIGLMIAECRPNSDPDPAEIEGEVNDKIGRDDFMVLCLCILFS